MLYNVINNSTFITPIGIHARGANGHFKFLDNTFHIAGTCEPDVKVVALTPGQHVVADIQGHDERPAGNCFSQNGRLEIGTVGQNFIFDYYVPHKNQDFEVIPCYYPTDHLPNGVNRFYTVDADHDPEGCSESNLNFSSNQENSYSSTTSLKDSLSTAISTNWINGNYVAVKTIFRNIGTTYGMRELYGVYIALGQLDSAEIVLNSIPVNSLDDAYFKQVQELNLERLNENHWPVYWNYQERQLLDSIAQSDEISAAYAKSLLRLAGQVIEIKVQTSVCNNGGLRKAAKERQQAFKIYPNPTRDKIEITWEGELQGRIQWTIQDINGRKVMEGILYHNGQEINVSQLPSGTFIISLRDNTGLITNLKFVKL